MKVITQSSISQFKACRKQFYFRQVLSLVPRLKSEARGIGSAVHKGLEGGSIVDALALFDNIFPSDQEEADKLAYNKAVVRAMLEGYFEIYGVGFAGEFRPEVQFDVPIINPSSGVASRSFRLAGKVDGLLKDEDGYWLVEYKTSGSSVDKNYVDRLMLDSQLTTYIYALQRQEGIKINGVIYRVLRKPSIRQTKKETFEQFVDRLIEDYKNRPEFYFYSDRIYRSQEDMAEFERELWDLTQDMLKCQREGLWYKDTSRCGEWGRCDYMPLCLHETDANSLYEQEDKNIELKEGDVVVA